MIEINLVPDVKRELLRTRMLRNMVISVAIIVGIAAASTAVVLGLIVGGQWVREQSQDAEIAKKAEELRSVDDLDKTVAIQQQLTKINELHEKKNINSRLLDLIHAINPPAPNDVRFSSVKLNPEEKSITIEGSAQNGYSALEVLKKTIMNTKIQTKQDGNEEKTDLTATITDGDTSFGEDAEGKKVLRFSFSFTYDERLFAVSKDKVGIITPTKQTDVTDSKLGIPSSLFAKKPADIDTQKKEEQ